MAFGVAQDARRDFSIGRLTTTDDTANFAVTHLASVSPNVMAMTSLTAGLIATTVSVPLDVLDLFGIARIFSGARMTVEAAHLMEN